MQNEIEIKELPFKVDGSFSWLENTRSYDEWTIGERGFEQLPLQLKSAISSACKHDFTLPNEFVKFIGTPALHAHVRSVGGCYLDVAESLLPFTGGYLLRFLADQQGCGFWYLYMDKGDFDHCVVTSIEYFDADDIDSKIDKLKVTDFKFAAESFEAFLMRFWLENEILFAEYESTPMPIVDPKFIELYSS